jgi:hypothetical protein
MVWTFALDFECISTEPDGGSIIIIESDWHLNSRERTIDSNHKSKVTTSSTSEHFDLMFFRLFQIQGLLLSQILILKSSSCKFTNF